MYFKSSNSLLLAMVAVAAIGVPGRAQGQHHPPKAAVVLNALAAQPLSFEANTRPATQGGDYFARGNGYGLFLNAGEADFALRQPVSDFHRQPKQAGMVRTEVLRMRLSGGNRRAVPTALQPLPGKVSYFLGNDPKAWRTGVRTFGRVRYGGVYPGIDLIYYGNQRQLEYDFAVAPHADPHAIRLDFTGSRGLQIDPSGALNVKMTHGSVRWNRPVVYQNVHGVRHDVAGRFVRKGAHGVGFEVARYDPKQPLIIDPILSYSSYFEGNGYDVGRAMTLDAAGNVYICGNTTSTDFPVTQGGTLGVNNGGGSILGQDVFKTDIKGDAFILKLSPAGYVSLSAYVGGKTGSSVAYGIAVDTNGNVFITGTTNAFDFPVNKPDQANPSVEDMNDFNPYHTYDAFLYKLDPTFNNVVFSTHIGGKFQDVGFAVAVDRLGVSYVTGMTNSPDLLRPGTDPKTRPAGETDHTFIHDHTFNNAGFGGYDAFLTVFDAAGRMQYETYYGGGGDDAGYGIAISARGPGTRDQVYITGKATAGLTLRNATNSTPAGNTDAFLAVFEYQGLGAFDTLAFSTYLGGAGDDRGMGIAIDNAQNVYVCGVTTSADFPTTNDAAQEFIGGSFENTATGFSDGFLVRYGFGNPRYNTDGTITLPNLVQNYGTYLGGTFNDEARAVAVDKFQNCYVAGVSNSRDMPQQIPYTLMQGSSLDRGITAPFDFSNPDHDHNAASFGVGWIGKITPDGALAYSTNWGGTRHTAMNAIAVNSKTGSVYFAGETDSFDYPTTADAYQPNGFGGKHVAFGKIIPAVTHTIPYDLNRDGKPDLFFQKTTDGSVSYLLLNGTAFLDSQVLFWSRAVPPPHNLIPQPMPPVVATADLDGDGNLDFLFQDYSTGDLTYSMERLNLDGYAGGIPIDQPYHDGFIYTGLDKSYRLVAAPDLNGDGKPDLLFENSQTGQLYYVLMDGVTPLYGLGPVVFKAILLDGADLSWQVVGTPDITGDGQPDVVFQHANGDVYYAPTSRLGNSISLNIPGVTTAGNFADNYLIQNLDANYRLKGFIDLNGDGVPDMIFQNRSTGDIAYGLMGKPVGGRAVAPRIYGFLTRGVDIHQQIVGIH